MASWFLVFTAICFAQRVSSFSPMYVVVPSSSHAVVNPKARINKGCTRNASLHGLRAKGKQGDDDGGGVEYLLQKGKWTLPNDFNLFLNQCTLQSMMFLLLELKDRQTAKWLEKLVQPIIRQRTRYTAEDFLLDDIARASQESTKGGATSMGANEEIQLMNYHGLAIWNTTLYPTWESFYEKLLSEPAETYTVTSENEYIPDYDLEINPASLCSRLISVREQIAREFVNDLHVIEDMGDEIIQRYWDDLDQKRNTTEEERVVQRGSLLFLEDAINAENWMYSVRPSPLRKGNFDLLVLLTTQESIHRLLNGESKLGDDRASMEFLSNFYLQRVGTHFTGSNFYGKADDFLEELLSTPPQTVQIVDEEIGLVDPTRLVELILEERENVAIDWEEIAHNAPESHTSIKRWQLNLLMGIEDSIEEDSFQ